MSIISPSRFINLKSRVKAECKRRSYNGSVTSYASSSYDYTNTPSTDKIIAKEHFQKIAVPLNAINSTKTPNTEGSRIISESEIASMEANLSVYERRAYYDSSNSDCSASCTGMCYSCTGTCFGDCSGSCSGNCFGCGGNCSGGCDGCGSGCADWCEGTCSGGCYRHIL